jgi:hypothetical protein
VFPLFPPPCASLGLAIPELVKTEVPYPRWLGSSRACPELHLACRDSHHDNQPSRLLCAQGSETSTPHSTWERAKVCPNPALARAPDSSRAQLTRTDAPFLLSWQVRASRSSRSPTTLARRSKQPVPPPPSCGANHCPGTPCATPSQSRALFLHPHSDNSRLSRALRAQEHEAAQGRVDGPLLGCPRALLERQGEPRRPCRAKSSREHQGHGGQGSRALRCALLVCRAGCHPQSSLNCRACAFYVNFSF